MEGQGRRMPSETVVEVNCVVVQCEEDQLLTLEPQTNLLLYLFEQVLK